MFGLTVVSPTVIPGINTSVLHHCQPANILCLLCCHLQLAQQSSTGKRGVFVAAVLQALSQHERLGVPLPQRTAVQLPHLMLAAAGTGAGSSMKLLASVQEALVDLELHAPHTAPQQQYSGIGPSSPDDRSSNSSGEASRVHALREAMRERLVPPGAAGWEEVMELGASAAIGGVKVGYVVAKLLAAAAWKHLGLEDRPVGRQTSSSSFEDHNKGYESSEVGGGVMLKEAFFRAGCYQPGHHIVMGLLGGSDVLQPHLDTQGSRRQAAGCCITGWAPNLSHSVYQDLDLL